VAGTTRCDAGAAAPFLDIEGHPVGLVIGLGSDIPSEALSFARANSRTAKRDGAQTAFKLPVKLLTAIC
jgi:hypothetical protein